MLTEVTPTPPKSNRTLSVHYSDSGADKKNSNDSINQIEKHNKEIGKQKVELIVKNQIAQ